MSNMSDRKIIQVFAELYNTHERAKIIAQFAGLRTARIPYSPELEIYWFNIWTEAKLQHKELELVKIAQEDYQRDERIIRIFEQIILQRRQSLLDEPKRSSQV